MAVAFVAPLVAAYVVAPAETLAAWPVWGLTFVPAFFVMIAGTVFRAYRPLVDAPLPATAGAWLQATISELGMVGISVAAMERSEGRSGNFYHPASRTIVLDDSVHGEHTARAYATAAHELGHAIFHNERPLLSRVLLAARGGADRCFYQGVALLFGTVIAGDTSLRWAAFALIALAVVLHALVVVDETIASASAGVFLQDDLGEADQGRIARNHLRRALATYASILVAYVVPLVVAPWVLHGDAGVIVPGAALDGIAETFADIGAWIVLVGAVAGCLYVVGGGQFVVLALGMPLVFLALLWTPLVAGLLCDQPDIPRWTVALAAVPAWSMLVTPVLMVVRWFGSKLAADVDMMPMPARTLERVSRKKLAEAEPDRNVWSRAMTYSLSLWIVPLALAWLGLL